MSTREIYVTGNDGGWGWILAIILGLIVAAIVIYNNQVVSCAYCPKPATCQMESPSGKASGWFCDEHSAEMAEQGWRVI